MLEILFGSQCSGLLGCFAAHNRELLTIVTGFISSIAVISTFLFGIIQYRIAQKWKRNEFLAQKVEQFFQDEQAMVFFSMLDYYGKIFKFDENGVSKELIVYHYEEDREEPTEGRYVEDLGTALHSHEDGPVNAAQEYIRNLFDRYCFYLQNFAIFAQNGLFDISELEPYIRYYIDIINAEKTHSQGYHEKMFQYLVLYEQNWTLSLLEEFTQPDFVKAAIAKAKIKKESLGCRPGHSR